MAKTKGLRWWMWVAVVIVVLLVVGGVVIWWAPWGTQQSAHVEKEEILFGGSCSITGQYSLPGERELWAVQLWVDRVNAKGGIYVREYGKKLRVRYIFYDDKSDPTTAAKLYEKLITEDKIDFAVTPYSSSIGFAVTTICEKYGVPFVYTNCMSDSILARGYQHIYMVGVLASRHGWGGIEMFNELGAKHIAIIAEKSEWSMMYAKGAYNRSLALGIPTVTYTEIEKECKDFTPLILKLKSENPDVVYAVLYHAESMLLVKQMKELNYRPKAIWCALGPEEDSWRKALGSTAEYIFGTLYYHHEWNTPGNKEFAEKFLERYGERPTHLAACPYATLEVYQQAIEKAGTLNYTAIEKVLRTTTFSTIYTANLTFLEFGYPAGTVVGCGQVIRGDFKPIWPPGWSSYKPTYPLPPEWP